MDSKEIPAGLKGFCEVRLIIVLGVMLLDFDASNYLRAEVMQDGASPYLLYDILIFLRVHSFEA